MTATGLVVTADDYGLTDGCSRAIIDAHHRGIVTATSVLAVVPGVERRLPWLSEAPDLSVGVHLAAVGEDPPLLSAREVPTLVGRSGRFPESWRHLLARLAAGRVDPDDLRREWSAQIAAVAEGRTLTHVDTHQHVHLWPGVAAVVVGLAVEHGISAVRVPRAGTGSIRGRLIAPLADRLADLADGAGLVRTVRFAGLDEAGGWTISTLVATLEQLGRGVGSVEINLHLGPEVDPQRDRYRWGYGWSGELAAVTSDEVAAAVRRCGFELVGR